MAGEVGAQGSERGKGARAPVGWKVSCCRLDWACPERFPPRCSVVRRRLDSHQHRSGLQMGSGRAGRGQGAAVRMGGVGRGGSLPPKARRSRWCRSGTAGLRARQLLSLETVITLPACFSLRSPEHCAEERGLQCPRDLLAWHSLRPPTTSPGNSLSSLGIRCALRAG